MQNYKSKFQKELNRIIDNMNELNKIITNVEQQNGFSEKDQENIGFIGNKLLFRALELSSKDLIR